LTEKRKLFVVGTGRSGTSAFARLLGRHSEIVIGMERYRSLPNEKPIAEWGDDIFSKEHFFGPGLKIAQGAGAHYEEQLKKFDTATWVGDKVPSWLLHVEALRARYPDSVFLYMFRDPVDVGHSWASRGRSATQGFWLGKTFENGFLACNKAASRAAKLLDRRFPGLFVVEFDRIYPYDVDYLSAVLATLDLEPDDRILEYYSASKIKSDAVAAKPRSLTEEQSAFVAANADPALLSFLRAHSVEALAHKGA
jgi:hypothetical protein